MRVCDVMTRSVVTTTTATPIKDAAGVLAGHGITSLPVIDETDQLVGVLTEADVVRGRIPPDPRRRARRGSQADPPPPTTVGEVMSSTPLTSHPETDAAELASTMIDRGRLRSVPVVDEDRLVGIITRRDLVRTIARNDALTAADVRKRLECYGAPDRWTVHVRHGSVTITDQYPAPADHHVALVLAQAVAGVAHAEAVHATSQRT
jgi:CBS-domain-containing membrane protein